MRIIPVSKVRAYGQEGSRMAKILVVEDDEVIRNLLMDTVMDMGFQVIEAEDGGAGLDKAINQLPDVILLDIMMPVMDGLQVLKGLKDTSGAHCIPVIIVDAKGRDEDAMRALRAGAWDYVTKPWEQGALEAVIIGAIK
jgi:DNA-binding response OmpR family regulator